MIQHLTDTDVGETEEIILERDEIFFIEDTFQFFFEHVLVSIETFILCNLLVPQCDLATTLIVPRGFIDGWVCGGWTCGDCKFPIHSELVADLADFVEHGAELTRSEDAAA